MDFPVDILGVMSGTSLDGLDLCLTHFSCKNNKYEFSIVKAITIKYPDTLFERLEKCRFLSANDLIGLHQDWGVFVGESIQEFFIKEGYHVSYIASHGHTVFHEPKIGITLQIGSLEQISRIVERTVVGDFRSLDVFKGGEGAPLVPIGDKYLFNEYPYCLNFGGIANISFEKEGRRKAFDVCPCNLLLNFLSRKLNKTYDAGGEIASEGIFIPELYEQLNNLPYYSIKKRPSLGIELIETEFISLLENSSASIADQLHTVCRHIAFQIRKVVYEKECVLCTGGGAYNSFLLKCLNDLEVNTVVPNRKIIEFKEALIFAFLALRKLEGKINVLESVTGASSDSSSGCVVSYPFK